MLKLATPVGYDPTNLRVRSAMLYPVELRSHEGIRINNRMKLHELFDDINEVLGRRAGLLGLGAALLAPKTSTEHNVDGNIRLPSKDHPSVQVSTSEPGDFTGKSANKGMQHYIVNYLQQHGLEGKELAAFLAQSSTETRGFKELEEHHPKQWFIKHYDITGNPAKARSIGNTQPGDGEKYKGRGFIHLSGKDNYERAAKALQLPLVTRPELVSNPEVAAKTALWYWKTGVKPFVTDWDNVNHVTRYVNSAGWGLADRAANYAHYKSYVKQLASAR